MEITFDPNKHHRNMTLDQVIQIRLREIDEEREKREKEKAAQQSNDEQLELPFDAKPT